MHVSSMLRNDAGNSITFLLHLAECAFEAHKRNPFIAKRMGNNRNVHGTSSNFKTETFNAMPKNGVQGLGARMHYVVISALMSVNSPLDASRIWNLE